MIPNFLAALRDAALNRSKRPEPPSPLPAPEPRRPSGPKRRVVGRLQFRGMLWRPALEVIVEDRLVVSAKAGLPHCARCERPLALTSSPIERWTCAECADSHPAADADFFAADEVVARTLREFFAARPDFAPAPDLSAPKAVSAA